MRVACVEWLLLLLLIHTFSATPLVITRRYEGQRVTSFHGDNPLLKETGTQNVTKPLTGPTNREHRKLIGVKKTSLGTNYIFYCLECVFFPFILDVKFVGCTSRGVKTAASISSNTSYKLSYRKRLSDVLPIQQSHQK